MPDVKNGTWRSAASESGKSGDFVVSDYGKAAGRL